MEKQPKTPKPLPTATGALFEWYEVKQDHGTYQALPSPYGVIYIDKHGQVSYSSRDYFDRTYTIVKSIPSININFESDK